MMVTKDKYELPLAVADTRKELGKILGVSPVTIANSITRARRYGQKANMCELIFQTVILSELYFVENILVTKWKISMSHIIDGGLYGCGRN